MRPWGFVDWYTQNYVSCNLWHRNAFTVHTACDLGWVSHNFQCSSPFCKRLHQGAQIFCKWWSKLKIPGARWVAWTRFRTQDPQMVGHHPTKFSRPGLLYLCASGVFGGANFVMSCLALPSCSLLDTKQVCGKFIAVHQESPQTAHRSIWTLQASSCASVRPSIWNISALNWTIFLKFGISLCSKTCREKENSLISDRCHW